jgi:hypothetical protein
LDTARSRSKCYTHLLYFFVVCCSYDI